MRSGSYRKDTIGNMIFILLALGALVLGILCLAGRTFAFAPYLLGLLSLYYLLTMISSLLAGKGGKRLLKALGLLALALFCAGLGLLEYIRLGGL